MTSPIRSRSPALVASMKFSPRLMVSTSKRNGNPGGAPKVRLKGLQSSSQANDILWRPFIDGVEVNRDVCRAVCRCGEAADDDNVHTSTLPNRQKTAKVCHVARFFFRESGRLRQSEAPKSFFRHARWSSVLGFRAITYVFITSFIRIDNRTGVRGRRGQSPWFCDMDPKYNADMRRQALSRIVSNAQRRPDRGLRVPYSP